METLATLIAIAVIAWFLTKALPGAVADFVNAARGKRPPRRNRHGFSGFLTNWWDDAWEDLTNWRRDADERAANRQPGARKPGFRQWLSTWLDNRVASPWRDTWDKAISKEMDRRREAGEEPPPYGPCQWCNKLPLAPRIRDTSVYGHIDDNGQPWCIRPDLGEDNPETADRPGDPDHDGQEPPGQDDFPDGDSLDRACRRDECDGTQRPVPGTAIDTGDGHMQALSACDKCGARDRIWWCKEDPTGAHGWISILDPEDDHHHEDTHGDGAAGKDADPAAPDQEPAGPTPNLYAERDGKPLDVQLLKPVPTSGGPYQYQEVHTMAEITGLNSAISTTGMFAKALDDTGGQTEAMIAGLEANGVTGPAVAAMRGAMENLVTAANAFRNAEAELKRHIGVQEAYNANQGAGTRDFVTSE